MTIAAAIGLGFSDWRKCWPSSGDTHLGKAGNVMSNENDRLVADFAC